MSYCIDENGTKVLNDSNMDNKSLTDAINSSKTIFG